MSGVGVVQWMIGWVGESKLSRCIRQHGVSPPNMHHLQPVLLTTCATMASLLMSLTTWFCL